MVKNTRQISLMQQRHGKLNELPKQLSTAQIGFADDTNGLFIGNPDHPTLKERYESDTFPYGNVEILTEFSDNSTLIKHSPWMNDERLYYPKVLEGTNSTIGMEINVGSSIFINDQEIEFTDSGVVVNDYDYLLLRYFWTDGTDLDTDTRISNATEIPAINNLPIGWSRGTSVPTNSSITNSVMYWAGDQTGQATIEHPLEENILISRNNLLSNDYLDDLPDFIDIQLKGTWYSVVGHNPVKLEIFAYKGGVMDLNPNTKKFTNIGGEQVKFRDRETGELVDSIFVEVTNLSETLRVYNDLAHITINKRTGSTSISIEAGENSEGNDTIISLDAGTIDAEEAVNQINDAQLGVEARIVKNKIQLITINESMSIDDGVQIGDVSTLETLGFEAGLYHSQKITKRSLQNVLDDRYSIKSFDVYSDDEEVDEMFADRSEYINKAFRILYNTKNVDLKELYFPADSYTCEDSLMLLTNAHLVGEGIDRTIIKGKNSSQPLLVLADWYLYTSLEEDYCNEREYPHNILIENMTFDISRGDNSSIMFLNHCYDIEFRNCKFILGSSSDFIKCQDNSCIKNIKFNNCIFDGNGTSSGKLLFNGEINGLLITNCEFYNISSTVITLNGNENYISNAIIGNNKFTNCGLTSKKIIQANIYTKYISIVKSLIDENVLKRKDGFTFFETESDMNYCDTPIYGTDPNKFLRFHFYQSVYDYVQELYNKYGKTALEVISGETDETITNHLKLLLGDENNDNTISLNSISQSGSLEIGVGKYGDLHLGKLVEEINEWEPNYPYNKMEIVSYEDNEYICVVKHTSSDTFDSSKWKLINSSEIALWEPNTEYDVNDVVIYDNILYICKEHHTSIYEFEINYWDRIDDTLSYIILHKYLDTNNQEIVNNKGDIIFGLKDNKILIDDNSEIPYEKRIGNEPNSIASVKYVNDAVNSGSRLKYNTEEINKKVDLEKQIGDDSSDISLIDFDSSIYGSEIYLKTINVNVRQLFIPISEQIRGIEPQVCKYLDWTNSIPETGANEYEVDDVISIFNESDDTIYYYKCLVSHTTIITEPTDYENFMLELNNHWWEEIVNQLPINYTEYSSHLYAPVTWYRGDVVKYTDTELYEENGVQKTRYIIRFYECTVDHVASYKGFENSFKIDLLDGKWKEILLDYSNIINDETGQLKTEYAVNISDYEYYSNHSLSGNYAHLTNYIGGNIWVTLPDMLEVIDTVPDLRYISIKSVDKTGLNEPQKWLFDINDVNVLARDTNGFNYPAFETNHLYHYGDIVNFNYSNFKCIATNDENEPTDHLSRDSHIDLHDSDVWEKYNEQGFNYEFNFEKDLLIRETDGSFSKEPYQMEHNMADHELRLCFYDANGDELELLQKNASDYIGDNIWQPHTFYYTNQYVKYNNIVYIVMDNFRSDDTFSTTVDGGEEVLKEINSKQWVEQTNYYNGQYISYGDKIYQVNDDYKSSTSIDIDEELGQLTYIPVKYIQIGETGEMIITVKYMKGE